MSVITTYLDQIDEYLERSIEELERKNAYLRKNNQILKSYLEKRSELQQLEEESETKSSSLPVDTNRTNAEEQEKESVVSLPQKLDEVLKLARSTRLPSQNGKVEAVPEKVTSQPKNLQKHALSKPDRMTTESKPKPSGSGASHRVPLRMYASSANPNPPSRGSNHVTAAVAPPAPDTASIIETPENPKLVECQQYLSCVREQLQFFSKVRMFGRLKVLFLSTEKLTASRQWFLSRYNRAHSHCVHRALSKYYHLPVNTLISKDEILSEVTALRRVVAKSTGIKYLLQKLGKLTNEMWEDLFHIWFRSRQLLMEIAAFEKRNDYSVTESSLQRIVEPLEVKGFAYMVSQFSQLLQRQLFFSSQEIKDLFEEELSRRRPDVSFGNKKAPFQKDRSPETKQKQISATAAALVQIRIDNYYQQVHHCFQYLIEYCVTNGMDSLTKRLVKLIETSTAQRKLSATPSDLQHWRAVQETKWMNLLRTFRILHSVLINEAKRVSCVFIARQMPSHSTIRQEMIKKSSNIAEDDLDISYEKY